MPNATNNVSMTAGGIAIQRAVTRSGSGLIAYEETLDAAEAGELTTRTDATTGEITMDDAGHTIETGNVIDIYWDGGVQYGSTVGTVSGTAVPISGGSGDDLPANNTDVTVVVQRSVNTHIDGDEVALIAMVLETNDSSLRTDAHIQLRDSGDAEIAEIDLVANVPQVWDIEGGANNPFTGNPITNSKVSQEGTDSGETYKLKIIGVQDASP